MLWKLLNRHFEHSPRRWRYELRGWEVGVFADPNLLSLVGVGWAHDGGVIDER